MFWIIGLSLFTIHVVIVMFIESKDLYDDIGEIVLDTEIDNFLNRNKKLYEY